MRLAHTGHDLQPDSAHNCRHHLAVDGTACAVLSNAGDRSAACHDLAIVWQACKCRVDSLSKQKVGPFAPKSQLRLTRDPSSANAWVLKHAAWWAPRRQHVLTDVQLAQCRRGWTMHEIEFQAESTENVVFNFSRRYGSPSLNSYLRNWASSTANKTVRCPRDLKSDRLEKVYRCRHSIPNRRRTHWRSVSRVMSTNESVSSMSQTTKRTLL